MKYGHRQHTPHIVQIAGVDTPVSQQLVVIQELLKNSMTEDKVRKPLQIGFIDPREIRMGSPYNLCEIRLSGKTNIKLEKNAWQDLALWTNDNKYLILVKWNLDKNEPGFHFVIFNIATGDKVISERIMGCLNSMEFENGKIKYKKFLYSGQKTEDGELIGNIDEEYSLQQF